MRFFSLIESERSIMPSPERWLDPKHKEHRPGLGDFAKGGKYLHMPAKADVTGETVTFGFIDVTNPTRPDFKVSQAQKEPATKADGRLVKTNLFKQKAGWKWVSEDLFTNQLKTIVSVESGSAHLYALRVNFNSGVTLARYANASSEPRLRPTTYGSVTVGREIGRISIRGREHVVYDKIEVN